MAQKRKVAAKATGDSTSGGGPDGGSPLNVDAVRQIVELLEASDVTRLVWTRGNERLFIRRDTLTSQPQIFHATGPAPAGVTVAAAAPVPVAQVAAPAQAPVPAVAAPAAEKPGHVITSPFVGTFYRAPSPEQPSFVEVGTQVKKGQVLCIIEAMKLMNEIESELEGRVVEVLAENGQPVEFGQPLFRLEKT
jgi:acetyl-CoA carboxylase biotin carboxyl carrier protein